MKKMLLFICLLFTVFCNSQSYLIITTGVDFADMDAHNPEQFDKIFEIYEKSYSVESLFGGIKGQHHLSKDFSISLGFFFTKKKMMSNPNLRNFFAYKWVSFKSLQGNFLFNYHIADNWQIEAGPTIRYIYGATKTASSGYGGAAPWERFNNKREVGITLSPGYRYKNLLAEVYYNKSVTPVRGNEYDFKPIDSFGISLSYLFQISKSKR